MLQAALRELQQQLETEQEHSSRLQQQLQGAQLHRHTQDTAAQACVAVTHCSVQTETSGSDTENDVAVEGESSAGVLCQAYLFRVW